MNKKTLVVLVLIAFLLLIGCVQKPAGETPAAKPAEGLGEQAAEEPAGEVIKTPPVEEVQLTGLYTSPQGFTLNKLGFTIAYPADWNIEAVDKVIYNQTYLQTRLAFPAGFSLEPIKLWKDWDSSKPAGYTEVLYYNYNASVVFTMTNSGSDFNVWYPERLSLDKIEELIRNPPKAIPGYSVELIELKRITINGKDAVYAQRTITNNTTGIGVPRIDFFMLPGIQAMGGGTDVVYVLTYSANRPPYPENFEKYKAEALAIINSFKMLAQ